MQPTINARYRYGILLISILLHLLLLSALLGVIYEAGYPYFDSAGDTTSKPVQGSVVHFMQEPNAKPFTAMAASSAVADTAAVSTPDSPDTNRRDPSHDQIRDTTPVTVPPTVAAEFSDEKNIGSTFVSHAPPEGSGQAAVTGRKKIKTAPKPPDKTGEHALTFGNLAQGFIQSASAYRQQSMDPIDERQRVAFNTYAKKSWGYLQQSFRGNYRLIHLAKDLNTKVVIKMTLTKEGKILDLTLEHPHKTHELKEIEAILLRAAKAGGLFPPMPKILNRDIITISLDLGINARQGFHLYDFIGL